MVTTCFPAMSLTGTEQDLTACWSTTTVHAPHSPAPQPNLVPVRPRSERSTHSNMRSSSVVTLAGLPLSVNEMVRCMEPPEGESEFSLWIYHSRVYDLWQVGQTIALRGLSSLAITRLSTDDKRRSSVLP